MKNRLANLFKPSPELPSARQSINESAPRCNELAKEILGCDWYSTEISAKKVIEWIVEQENRTLPSSITSPDESAFKPTMQPFPSRMSSPEMVRIMNDALAEVVSADWTSQDYASDSDLSEIKSGLIRRMKDTARSALEKCGVKV